MEEITPDSPIYQVRIGLNSMELLKHFESWLIAQNLSVATVRSHVRQVRSFLTWFGRSIEDLSSFDIACYLAECRKRGLSEASVNRYASALKKFLRFLASYFRARRRVELANYFEQVYREVKVPKYDLVEVSIKRHMEPDTARKVIDLIHDPYWKCFFAVLYETGLRLRELRQVKVSDVHENKHGFEIVVRDSKTPEGVRKVYVVEYYQLLRYYLEHVRPRDSEWLFPARRDPRQPISEKAIYSFLNRFRKRTGIVISPHRFRHARATELYRKGVSEQSLMRLFGWRTRTMIDVYSKLSQRDVESELLSKVYGLSPVESERSQTRKCPRCGAEVIPTARYCPYCGLALDIASVLGKEEQVRKYAELIEALLRYLEEHPEYLSKLFSRT
ncbi:MAG: hypothetical protein DRJ40_07260 [Thermoprotei archaeon]|nr:MAG: hypothetical protein DRJ40_07260 [Thermoprotei archaeon]